LACNIWAHYVGESIPWSTEFPHDGPFEFGFEFSDDFEEFNFFLEFFGDRRREFGVSLAFNCRFNGGFAEFQSG
jgi:hypothetical protein